jgi:23S rRNA pseudouridine955/2504/2580 synthase/23S rRNA pseudouridine1911/1915/1917 synthase
MDPVLLSTFKKKFKLSKEELDERPLLNRLALHAYSMELTNLQEEPLSLTAPLSKDLETTLKQLGKWGRK